MEKWQKYIREQEEKIKNKKKKIMKEQQKDNKKTTIFRDSYIFFYGDSALSMLNGRSMCRSLFLFSWRSSRSRTLSTIFVFKNIKGNMLKQHKPFVVTL